MVLSIALAAGVASAFAMDDVDSPSPWAVDEVARAIELGFVPEECQSNYTANITRAEFANMALSFVAFQYHYENYDGWDRGIGSFLARIPYAVLQPEQRDRVTVLPTYYRITYGFAQQLRTYFVTDNGGLDLAAFLAQPRIYQIDEQPPELEPPLFDDLSEPTQYEAWIYALGIVEGRGNGIFDPNGAITRQEAAAMLWRAYRVYGGDAPVANLTAGDFSDAGQIAPWAVEQSALLREWGVLNGVGGDRFDPWGYYTREQSIATFLRLYQNAPVSRKIGNVPPLVSAEMDVALMLDAVELAEVFFWAETDLAVVVYAQPSYVKPSLQPAIYIFHRTGGFTKVGIPYYHDALDLALSEDESTLRFTTHDFGATPSELVQFELDLRTATLTETGRYIDPAVT